MKCVRWAETVPQGSNAWFVKRQKQTFADQREHPDIGQMQTLLSAAINYYTTNRE
jgi:hypothetical protein